MVSSLIGEHEPFYKYTIYDNGAMIEISECIRGSSGGSVHGCGALSDSFDETLKILTSHYHVDNEYNSSVYTLVKKDDSNYKEIVDEIKKQIHDNNETKRKQK